MVFIRSLLGMAALAAAAVAAPTYDMSSSSYGAPDAGVSSGSSGCGSSGCGAPDSSVSSGSSSGSDCGSSGCGMPPAAAASSATMMDDSSSTMMMDSSSTMMEASSTMMMDSMATSMPEAQTVAATSTAAYSMATYGSGSASWNSGGYNSCVQQCVAQFGAPSAAAMPAAATASATSTDAGTGGSPGSNGATHTVIVAPSQGVLRYVPFAVNASVGDTIKFEWHANVHTVTKSSALEICNKTGDAPFVSGTHNASFTFFQVVNDTNPTFFYCGTPGHCQKGMFGIINPTSTQVLPSQAAALMPAAMGNSSTTMAMATYAQTLAANSSVGTFANAWGANMDMSAIPAQYHDVFTQNVQFTRAVIAANPDIVSNGKLSLAAASGPMMWPQDLATNASAMAMAGASASPIANAGAAAPSASGSSSAAAAAFPSPSAHNGARAFGASGALVAVAAGLAAFLAL